MKKSKRSRSLRKLYSLIFLTLPLSTIGILTCINTVKAQQVTSDGTVSTTVITTPDGKNFDINDGTRRGGNLFHSFKEFSVPTGGSANFNNAADVLNIIGRVTGGSVSNIDGLIRTLGKANLFLLNPAGIIFGPNARLNIGGSFLGSTANSFLFDNNFEFSATNPQAPPLLTINVPIGLRFRDNPQNIINQSRAVDTSGNPVGGLDVSSGKTLTLVGGNVNLDGGILLAPGGRIELGGLSTARTVGLSGDGSLSFPVGVQRGDVLLTNGAIVGVFAGGGGNIAVNARNLDLLGGSQILAGIFPGLGTPGAQAGDIKIDATDRVRIQATANSPGGIFNFTGNFLSTNSSNITEPGNAGNIVINTGTLEGNGYILIGSSTNGEGNAGRVSITAKDKVSLTGESANSLAYVGGSVGSLSTGNGADVLIDTPSLSLFNAAISTGTLGQGNAGNIQLKASESISLGGASQLGAKTFGRGNAGNIVIDAPNAAVSFDGTNTEVSTAVREASIGKGGDITIKARNLSATNGASLFTNTYGRAEAGRLANAGNIQINVLEDVSFKEGSKLRSSTYGQGNAGNVSVSAGGKISFDGKTGNFITGIFSIVGTPAEGNAGNIELRGRLVEITNGAELRASTSGKGNAGSVKINATDTISFSGVDENGISRGIFSSVNSGAQGKGGNIELQARSVSIADGAELATSTFGKGDAGSVKINATDTISFAGVDNNGTSRGISSNVESGAEGNAGNIELQARSVSVTDGAQLSVNTFGKGDAGSVKINVTDTISFSGTDNNGYPSGIFSRVRSRAEGKGGNIELQARSISIADGALLSTSTFGKGDAGSVKINATDSVSVISTNNNTAASVISSIVNSGAVGNGGEINITAGSFELTNGSQLNTFLSGASETTPAGIGNAGNVKLDIRNGVTITGVNNDGSLSGIFSDVESGAGGNAGGIDINARSLSVNDGGIFTTNFGNGAAGNIKVTTAKDIRLDNKAFIEANTNGGQGNISLNSGDLILRRNSNITTNARGTATGGNITINTGNLVALENSKITANAQQGYGGNIFITTTGGRFLSPDSVISATSEAGSQFNGIVQFNTQPNDPTRGLFELSETVIDPAEQIAQNPCNKGFGSTFTITGRGGLPTDPNKIISSDNVRVDLIQPVTRTVNSTSTTYKQPSQKPPLKKIVPAQGWIYNDKGEVVLVAYDPTKVGVQREQPAPNSSCAAVR
ncbi:filamentous hemagglutinin N-terminal domain-containing protein [Brasilonema sp. CT11]|nr:filamentous hemagglutinin N-terminal domain-containing protein [Brasilonema sp. CT11]